MEFIGFCAKGYLIQNLFYINQHAHTPGKSCDCSDQLVSRIENVLDNKEVALGVSQTSLALEAQPHLRIFLKELLQLLWLNFLILGLQNTPKHITVENYSLTVNVIFKIFNKLMKLIFHSKNKIFCINHNL